jgi:sterol 3beta-glucosyltransferase
MSRMLEAKAELSMRPSFDMPRSSRDNLGVDENGETTSSLAKRLMEIFNFEKAEDVIEGRTIAKFIGRNADIQQNTLAGC